MIGVEKAGAFQPAVGQLLQADTQGEHGHKRRNADSNAERSQGIPQH